MTILYDSVFFCIFRSPLGVDMICIVLGVESNEKSVLSLILNSISAPFSIHSLDARIQCRGGVPRFASTSSPSCFALSLFTPANARV